MMRGQDGVTGVSFSSPWAPGSLGLCAHSQQVVNIFQVVGEGGFTSAKQLRKFASYTINIKYFRKELRQRIWGKAWPGKAP